MTHPPDLRTPSVVLDTNVALDCLVFSDPRVERLASGILSGAICWLACRRMREELAEVLQRPPFAERRRDCELALTSFDRWARAVEPSVCTTPLPALRCADADDQIFIDLALGHRARWLFTRDKALLALAPAARRHGLDVVAPALWPGTVQTPP